MVAIGHGQFELSTLWHGETGRYELTLTHHGAEPISGFVLAISGPARISADAEVENGTLVRQLSNACEIAPPEDFVLAPGGRWTCAVLKMDSAIRHWTDGAGSGFVVLADGTAVAALTHPTALAGSAATRKRGTMPLPVPGAPPVAVSVVPWPRSVEVSGRRGAPHGLAIMGEDEATEAVADNFAALTQFLFPGEGIVRDDEEGGYPVDIRFDRALPADGYAIEFSEDGAEISGGAYTGLFYGLVTLGQIQRGARLHPQAFSFPSAGRIEDSPRFAWRGCHLDVARRFYSSEEVKQFIAILAWNKLNVMHWHLSDDEAWRVEIDAFPELVEKTAFRGHEQAIPPLLGSGPELTGGYYTKDAIRDIVAVGEDFGVEIVPEIDVPGHCYALLQALPQLRDPGDNGGYFSIQYFPDNALNPAVEGVYAAIETIFGEMCELFPSAYFHVGADEVPPGAWSHSPAANQMREQLGAEGTAPLQAAFLKRVQAFLSDQGKVTGAWEEAAQGGGIDKDDAYLVGWRTPEASRELAALGYAVVAAPAQTYYLDMALSEDWHECGAAWAGWSSVATTYAFTPDAGWSDAERERLMGVQGCIWSEPMLDRGVFDRLVFPRLSAIAETGWSTEANRDFDRFTALVGLMPNLYGVQEGR